MIKLINGYFVSADNYQYILNKQVQRTKKSDSSTYLSDVVVGYYGSMPSLIRGCIADCLRNGVQEEQISDLQEYRECILDLYRRIDLLISAIDIDAEIKRHKVENETEIDN